DAYKDKQARSWESRLEWAHHPSLLTIESIGVNCVEVVQQNPQEIAMRMLLDITIPHEPFNSLVRKGEAGQKLGAILEALKPEAIYLPSRMANAGPSPSWTWLIRQKSPPWPS